MKTRFILFPLFLFCLFFIFFLNKEEKDEDLKPLMCDLNLHSCLYDFKDKKVQIDFVNRPLEALQENEIIVSNLDEFTNLKAKIYGVNMYLGDVLLDFEKKDDAQRAKFILSACTLKVMRFRIEFFDGNKSLNLYADFDLRR